MSCRFLNGLAQAKDFLSLLEQRHSPDTQVENSVKEIIENIKKNGDDALKKYSSDFDCKNVAQNEVQIAVDKDTIANAVNNLSSQEKEYILQAAENIRDFHSRQKQESWFTHKEDGSIFGQRIDGVDRAGIYVPGGMGGNTPLISSILMGVIPAQVAGVKDIAIVTPPKIDGTINEHILATAHLLGIEEVYALGGAWAIAALAYGTQSVKKVNVIAGPGNTWVTTAKKLVQGDVGIDMLAGPSEILIIADSSAKADIIAADMLSQAEHDSLASSVLLTESEELAKMVQVELEKQLNTLPRAEIARASLKDYGAIILLDNLDEASYISNEIAPEHLELMVEDSWAFMPKIKHAGAIFMGMHTPEALGDYFAGPNHVLPTLGTAKFSSALGVNTFCKRTSIVAASKEFTKNSCQAVAALARLEALEAHARSIEIRN